MEEKGSSLILGKYRILSKIGEGGFGTVYQAHDIGLDRTVAIKVLHPNLAGFPDFLTRFRREARLAAALHHPNIVTMIEADEDQGRYYLVMDYLDGKPLSQYLDGQGSLPLAKVVEWLLPLADAIDYAHSKQIIHRDIKPSNVIITSEGRPVLTDFGLVKSSAEETNTTTGMILGTAEYMSPEQILGKDITPAADRYALGIMAYQMLTGSPPFKGKTPFEVQNGHVNLTPPDPRSLNPALPESISKILLTALEKDPSKRYPTAKAFIGELKRINDEFSFKQVEALINAARQHSENNQFAAALDKLHQAEEIADTDTGSELTKECLRRQQIFGELIILQEQQSKIVERMKQLYSAENWLFSKNKKPAFTALAKEPVAPEIGPAMT